MARVDIVLPGYPVRTARGSIGYASSSLVTTDDGRKILVDWGIGLYSIVPGLRMQGAPGSVEEKAVEFIGGIRSIFDTPIANVYDDEIARKRYQQVNQDFRRRIEARVEELKKKP